MMTFGVVLGVVVLSVIGLIGMCALASGKKHPIEQEQEGLWPL